MFLTLSKLPKFSLTKLLCQIQTSSISQYELHRQLCFDPMKREQYWADHANKLHWFEPFQQVLDQSNSPHIRWLTGGKFNISYNCFDRHILENKLGQNIALIYDSAYTKIQKKFTYQQLFDDVKKFSRVLLNQGLRPGDTVIIYMPMIPEAIVAAHACARIGVIHSIVFGGFAAHELSSRITDCNPKLIITASCGIEPSRIIHYTDIVDKALSQAHREDIKRIIVQRNEVYTEKNINPKFYLDYNDLMESVSSNQGADCEQLDSNSPLYILYTSGTTGAPKGIYRDQIGTAVSLDWKFHYIFNINKGDVYFGASDIGWIVGHSMIIYGPLLRGATSIMYEGKPVGTPDAGQLWRIIEQYRVKSLYCAPTTIRAIKKDDYYGELIKNYDLTHFEGFHFAGERMDPDTLNWIKNKINKEVHYNDNWWQTETGWPMCSNYLNLTRFQDKFGSTCKPAPGWDVQIFDEQNQLITQPNTIGKIMTKLPNPPGFMTGIWGNPSSFQQKYFTTIPGYYETGDAGYFDEDGYFYIVSRTDDVINTAGHRLSTGQLEEIINNHPYVVESAVVAKDDQLKGEVPFAFVLLVDNEKCNLNEVAKEIKQLIRSEIGAIASLQGINFVAKLPKTRSGKILRNCLKAIINKKEPKIPATIEDLSAITHIQENLHVY